MPKAFYRKRGKRIFDIALTAAALLAGLPFGVLIALIVRLSMGGPVLFKQERSGLNGRTFMMYKFRTMSNAADEHGEPLPDASRVTRTGSLLRSTSLDELPELFNILRGDMSLVGPRPLLPRYLPHYSESQARRHEVLPGLTGLAQTSGRNALSWDEQFELDVQYVDNISFVQDLKIVMQTVREVLSRDEERSAAVVTKPFFDESSN